MSKVLLVASVFSHLEHFHTPFIKWLLEKDHEVHAAASYDQGSPLELEKIGVSCWEIPFGRSPLNLSNARAVVRLAGLLRREHFDLIHVHTPVAAFLGRCVAHWFHHGSVLYTAHGFHFYAGAPFLNWAVYYSAERLARKWTSGLIVMNEEDYASALRLGFKEDSGLFLVHGVGVDLARFTGDCPSSIRAQIGASPHDVLFVTIGEINNNKNQAFLLEAWDLFSVSSQNSHLLIVGDGPLRSSLEHRSLAKSRARVHFLGFRTDIPAVLTASDVCISVSKREGLPRCIMEAMASGKPTIATNIRGNRDLVQNSITGILVSPGDVDALVSAMRTLEQDSSLRDEMGARARTRAQAYSTATVVEEMATIYPRFLSQSEQNGTLGPYHDPEPHRLDDETHPMASGSGELV